MNIKVILSLLIFLSITLNVKASLNPTKLEDLILNANKIVYGEISALDSLTYTLKIERNFTGNETELIIQKFKNWPCAERWTDYQIGQRLFVFLTYFDKKLCPFGGANEGELPIQCDSIFINGLALDPPLPTYSEEKSRFYIETNYLELARYMVFGQPKNRCNFFIC